MTIFFFWFLKFCVQSSKQSSELNCLWRNPGVLDVVFDFFHQEEYKNNLNTTAEDIAIAVSLIASRFKRIHKIYWNSNRTMRNIKNGMSLYANRSSKNFPIILYPQYEFPTENISSTIRMYEEVKKAVMRINIDHENLPVVGIYLTDWYISRAYEELTMHVEAVNHVFRRENPSSLFLGHLLSSCVLRKNDWDDYIDLKIVHFITCVLDYDTLSNVSQTHSPEDYADQVITACDQLRDNATYLNLTKEVMCIVDYPSLGTTRNKIVGSLENFQAFWCRIVDELVRNKSHAGIIMSNAIDLTPGHDGSPVKDLFMPEHNTGWWRRRSFHRAGEFVEKVEELAGKSEFGKCRGPCDLCSSFTECCKGMFCSPDSSIPPFKGRPPSVCRSKTPKCDQEVEPASVTRQGSLTFIILTFFLFFLFIIIIILLVYRRLNRKKVLSRQELRNFFYGFTSSPRVPSGDDQEIHKIVDSFPYDTQHEIPKSNFEIYENQILGSGEFGLVLKGRVGNDEVAVKTTLPGVDKVYFKALLSELKVLMHLGCHEAIVNFFGANTAQLASGCMYIFLELCPLGNLLEFLRKHRNQFSDDAKEHQRNPSEIGRNVLTKKLLLLWSVQIASALEYLARKKVIHGDIAARNVLVSTLDQVKLTDFGLSRRIYEYSNYIKKCQDPLPWRHMSAEALKYLSFSVESDVWAFAVTMWELFTLGEVPYPGQSCSEEFVRLLFSGLRPLQPQHAHNKIYEIMTLCWTNEVECRPPISLVYSKLTSALDQLYTKEHYFEFTI